MNILAFISLALCLGACASDTPDYSGYNSVGANGTPIARGYRECSVIASGYIGPGRGGNAAQKQLTYETEFDQCMLDSGFGRKIREK
jgi:hypothetical protein